MRRKQLKFIDGQKKVWFYCISWTVWELCFTVFVRNGREFRLPPNDCSTWNATTDDILCLSPSMTCFHIKIAEYAVWKMATTMTMSEAKKNTIVVLVHSKCAHVHWCLPFYESLAHKPKKWKRKKKKKRNQFEPLAQSAYLLQYLLALIVRMWQVYGKFHSLRPESLAL